VKRGFKAEAERIATEVRLELGLGRKDQLDPHVLARHLAIPVFTMDQVSANDGNSTFCKHFSTSDSDSFSAVTIVVRQKRMIVHNENHHPHRQASNISHEISHILLEHEPTTILSANGERFWNAEMEEEANWLGAALLVPRDGALQMSRVGLAITDIATNYGVSESLCRWRMTQTGILQQLARASRFGH
jgi:Zn-dependent peptidase ImmA (M78 family)